jgi:hypothetical protein
MHPSWLSPVRLLAAIAVILLVTGGAGAESLVPPGDRLAALEAYAKTAQAPFIQPVADASPPQPLDRYAGTFSNPVYGDLRVATDGTQLWLVAGLKQLKMLLVPRSRDTFIASMPEVDAFLGESGFATFAFGGDGKIASVALSQFADVEGGRFTVKPSS